MARRTRQISLKECYEILNLNKGADLAAVKSAYRRLAFELHPDLNPGNPEASRRFQRLNEAYVALSAMLASQEARQKPAGEKSRPEEARAEAGAESKSEGTADAGSGQTGQAGQAWRAYEEQDILRDLLNDSFARRVFEDIYREMDKKRKEEASAPPPPEPEKPSQEKKPEPSAKPAPPKEPRQIKTSPLKVNKKEKGVKGAVQSWLLKQLDDKQTLTLPASGLHPGRKVRLQIRPSLSEEVTAVDVTLPPDFVVGKPMRLRGMGKRVGPWQGDLYLTINSE